MVVCCASRATGDLWVARFSLWVAPALGVSVNNEKFADHDAFFPDTVNRGRNNSVNNAMTEFPFFDEGVGTWGIRGSGRWEVDSPVSRAALDDTHHRIWIR